MILTQPGKYDKLITLQAKTTTTDSYGGPVEAWTGTTQAWAKVVPIKGREMIAAQAAQSETTVRFYTRYRSGLSTAMRIVYGGNNYDITGIVDIEEQRVEMEISAKTGVSAG